MSIRRFLLGFVLALMLAGIASVAHAQETSIREAQQHLTELGYAPGEADGHVGPSTRGAISAFQRDNRLPISGVLDDLTLRTIRDSVINQTLFGGTVTLDFDRPEPEIVPLNADGSRIAAAAPTVPQLTAPEVEAASPRQPVGTDITTAIPVPDVAPDQAALPTIDRPAPTTLSDLLDQVVGPGDLPSRLEALSGSEFVPPVDYSSLETGVLPQLDLDGEAAPLVPALAPVSELASDPTSGWLPEISIFDQVLAWVEDYLTWAVILLVAGVSGWLVWRLVGRLFGSSEPKRVAMTRAEYLVSAGAGPSRLGTRGPAGPFNTGTMDDDTQIGSVEGEPDWRPDSNEAGPGRPRPVAPDDPETVQELYDQGPTPVQARPQPVHRPSLGNRVDQGNDDPPGVRQVSSRQTVVASGSHEARVPDAPRIVPSVNDRGELSADNTNTRMTRLERPSSGDAADIRARRSRDPHSTGASSSGRSGASEGGMVRPTRRRREGI